MTFKNAQKKPAAATAGRLRVRGIPKNKISKATEEVYTSLHSDNIGNNQVSKIKLKFILNKTIVKFSLSK